MQSVARWSIQNRVTVNLILILVILAGFLALSRMRREVFPQFSLDFIQIAVDYTGASPEEIEEGICIKIEEQIKGIEGISRLLSIASEGRGLVLAELDVDNDEEVRTALDEINAEVDRIDTFPENAEKPSVVELVLRDPVISVAVYGDVSERQLRLAAERIRDDLVDTPAISQANLLGVRDYEISIEVSEENLRRYGLTFDEVAAAVRTASLDLPGGLIKTPGGDVLIRAKGQRYLGREFENIPLITHTDGTILRLGEVAALIDGFEDTDQWGRFDGKPMAMVQVVKTSEEDIIEIARTVRDYVEAHRQSLPEEVHLAIWGDLSKLVQDRINLLLKNGTQGILLVFLCLALFLNFRLAFWVALGIPVAFMGAFFVLHWHGDTINMISLFAFIMTLGILVDDAIILGENVYSHHQQGKPPTQAVVEGVGEVGWPVVMAVTTTIVAFAPLLFITGIMGKFIAVLPTAVITILTVSLLEALFILPAHLDGALSDTPNGRRSGSSSPPLHLEGRGPQEGLKADSTDHAPARGVHVRLLEKVDQALQFLILHYYTPSVRFAIKNRYFCFILGLGVLIVTAGMVIGGHISFVLFPRADSDWMTAEVSYPLGTPVHITERTLKRLESAAMALNRRLTPEASDGEKMVRHVLSLVGQIPSRDWKAGEKGGHAGQAFVELLSSEDRPGISANDLLHQWRKEVGEVPGVEKMSFSLLHGGPAGNPIEIQLIGPDFDVLKRAASELKAEIASYPGTYDVADDFKPGKEEKKLKVETAPGLSGFPCRISPATCDRPFTVRKRFGFSAAGRISRSWCDMRNRSAGASPAWRNCGSGRGRGKKSPWRRWPKSIQGGLTPSSGEWTAKGS